jgi:hypothetical protein
LLVAGELLAMVCEGLARFGVVLPACGVTLINGISQSRARSTSSLPAGSEDD